MKTDSCARTANYDMLPFQELQNIQRDNVCTVE